MSNHQKSSHLTFSQREGNDPLPEPMQLQYLSKDFRNLIWYAVDRAINNERDDLYHNTYESRGFMYSLTLNYQIEILHLSHDARDQSPDDHRQLLRKIILTEEYDKVLTLIEFILRNGCSTRLRGRLESAFEDTQPAYFIGNIAGLPTICPRSSEEAGESTKQAIEDIEHKGPSGAKEHLRKAAQLINEGRYAESVSHSIHAVESVARNITPGANKLGPALNFLEKQGVLNHPALKQGLEKIYGYTCDEKGIRHALLDKSAADVDLDDAVFMFSACSSFTSYLINKHERVTEHN